MWLNLFSTLDNRLSDLFVRQVAQKLSPDPDIVIVDIDEASLAAMQMLEASNAQDSALALMFKTHPAHVTGSACRTRKWPAGSMLTAP